MAVTTIGEFYTQPEPAKAEAVPQTLADVPRYVAVEDGFPDATTPFGYATWRDDTGHILKCRYGTLPLRVFVSINERPESVRVHSVLGPITAIQFGEPD